jgi:hypothetical protein
MLTQMRCVSLTPMLPLVAELDDERPRRLLYSAFKAASLFVAKAKEDVLDLIQDIPPRDIRAKYMFSAQSVDSPQNCSGSNGYLEGGLRRR